MTGPAEDTKSQLTLLSSKLLHQHQAVEAALNRHVFVWKEIEEKSQKRNSGISKTPRSHIVQVSEIVGIHKVEDEDHTKSKWDQKKTLQFSQLFPNAFTVFYVKRTKNHRWRCNEATFSCSSAELCEQWIQVTREQLSLLTNRPKRLLVYINPFGGKRRGKRIYEEKVAPVFQQAGISADVIVTERANHARDHLTTEANLQQYDGVVCVGGDGMFSEILHGLVARTQNDNKVDQKHPDAELKPCMLRIGIIPAGSTDCICFATVGTNDPVTSALHIIIGDSQPMDVCSVHHNDVFLRYSVSLLGYGFYGDVLADSEKKRWLGPARYDLSGVKAFLCHNYYKGTVSFLPAEDNLGHPRDKLQCRFGCSICQHKQSSKDKLRETADEETAAEVTSSSWKVICGKFIAINAANMSCACPRSPKGLSPSAHLADGTADLILVRKCSRLDFFRHLLRHTNTDDQFDHSFVEVHRVKKFHFEPLDPQPLLLENQSELPKKPGFCPMGSAQTTCIPSAAHSSWNCDGEILHHAAIQVSVHRQLIRLFARGIEEQQQRL
uniref:Ceramide kinase n=1 Tax=Oryzias latipes TaxID=8090 RepID=A0A3P9JSU9_ORYLA